MASPTMMIARARRRLWIPVLATLALATPSCGKLGGGGTKGAGASSADPSPASQGNLGPAFADLLRGRGLSYEATPGYDAVSAKAGAPPQWRHEHAVRSSKFPLEIRYGAAPKELGERLHEVCGGDARCKAAPSNEAILSLLDAAVRPVAKGGKSKRSKAFPLDAVREEFRAHWGGVAAFDVDPSFTGAREGIAVIIYREGPAGGAAMFAGFYDEHSEALEDEWMRAFHSLKFAEPFAAAESEAAAAPLVRSAFRCDNGFVQIRFLPSTWTVIHVSAAMAVMGQKAPYETIYHDIKYLPDSRFSARVFRVDNMEMGDRTPKQPKDEVFPYTLSGDKLVIDLGESKKWECERAPKR
jgi:hypothetical protein